MTHELYRLRDHTRMEMTITNADFGGGSFAVLAEYVCVCGCGWYYVARGPDLTKTDRLAVQCAGGGRVIGSVFHP